MIKFSEQILTKTIKYQYQTNKSSQPKVDYSQFMLIII